MEKPSVYSLQDLPRDAKIILMKIPGVRRRCMMLCKSFLHLACHEDFTITTRALSIRAQTFRPRFDRVESLISYIDKVGPNCVDLEFKDCFLPRDVIEAILAGKCSKLQKLSFSTCSELDCRLIFELLFKFEWPLLRALDISNQVQVVSTAASKWPELANIAHLAPQLHQVTFNDSNVGLSQLCELSKAVASISYLNSDIEKFEGCLGVYRDGGVEDLNPQLLLVRKVLRNHVIFADELATIFREVRQTYYDENECYYPFQNFSKSCKVTISLLEISNSERDQIELVDLAGEPVYVYRPEDLVYFQERNLLANESSHGTQLFHAGLFDLNPNGDEPDSRIWKALPDEE